MRSEIIPIEDDVGPVGVFNNPALGPVGADHTVLIGSGRCPGGRSFVDVKSAHRNIADALFLRHKAVASDKDLHSLTVWIFTPEVCIENSLSVFLLTIPFIGRGLTVPGIGIRFTLQAFLQSNKA